MKGDIHSFHMRHRSLICYKRLHSYGGLKLLSVIALVVLSFPIIEISHKEILGYLGHIYLNLACFLT